MNRFHDLLCDHRSKLVSCSAGGLLGIGVSFVVNSTLAEISKNRGFAIYFGLLFMVLGSFISVRVYRQSPSNASKKFFLPFGLLIVLSGIICFVLEENWIFKLKPHSKIPLYGILGISVCFALNFAIVDVLNYVYEYLVHNGRPVIENKRQIISIVALTSLMGAVFGVVFGVVDYEDEEMYHKKLDLMKEEFYCFPIGGVLGAVSGGINDYFKSDYVRHNDEFEDEEI